MQHRDSVRACVWMKARSVGASGPGSIELLALAVWPHGLAACFGSC